MAPNPDSEVIRTPPSLEELFRKNPELSRTDLEYLQDWMSKQPHLPKLTDEQLVPFLHSNYYSLEKAKRTIENYFTIRTHAPNIFQNRDPLDPEVQKQISLVNFAPVGKKDSRGYRILGTCWRNPDPTDFDYEGILKVLIMMLDQEIREDPTCPGFVMVIDNSGTTMTHVTKASMSAIKVFLTYIQDALPCRMKEFNVINCNPLFDTILMIAKPFLQVELLKLLHLHSGEMDDLYRKFPRDILTKEHGGTHGSLAENFDDVVRRMKANRDWFLETDKLLVDESRRPGKAKSAGEVFGLEGSFKQLDID